MYVIKFTIEAIKAYEWVGGRYRHGYELLRLLIDSEGFPVDEYYDGNCPKEFELSIPEIIAWEIAEIIEEDGLTCLDQEATKPLIELHCKIV